MSIHHILAIALLALGVIVELACCFGVLLMPRALDRLHFVAPATAVGPIVIALAVIADRSPAQAEIKAVLVALALLLTGPILSHATARAILAGSVGEDSA